jgi:hypothetical protein
MTDHLDYLTDDPIPYTLTTAARTMAGLNLAAPLPDTLVPVNSPEEWLARGYVEALDDIARGLDTDPLAIVLRDVRQERDRQDARWGEQNHPSGTEASPMNELSRDYAIAECDTLARAGKVTWRHILAEEVAEAVAEPEGPTLRAELLQVAAVALAWVQCIDRRMAGTK